MSYILDALKKDQARQSGPGLKLGPQNTTPRALPLWLGISLAIILTVNLGLLVWLFVVPKLDEQSNPVASARDISAMDQASARQPANESAAVQPSLQQQAPMSSEQSAATTASTAPAPRPSAQSEPTNASQGAATPQPRPAPRRQPPAPLIALTALPAAEQALFNSFTYSTHIYTDDPSLCAIVIDGTRLTAGDRFNGLEVVRITEEGVVFEQNHNGKARHVAVSVMQQWGEAG